MKTFTSRAFNQDPTSVKKAAADAPVQITERGKPSYVMLSIEKYEELTFGKQNLVDLLAMEEDVNFEPETLSSSIFKPVSFEE